MKKIILIFFTSFIFALNLNQSDKQKHFLATAFTAVLSDKIYTNYYKNRYHTFPSKIKRYLISISSGIFAGFLKEMYDKTQKNDNFDHKDFQADILGSILGSILKIEIKWK